MSNERPENHSPQENTQQTFRRIVDEVISDESWSSNMGRGKEAQEAFRHRVYAVEQAIPELERVGYKVEVLKIDAAKYGRAGIEIILEKDGKKVSIYRESSVPGSGNEGRNRLEGYLGGLVKAADFFKEDK